MRHLLPAFAAMLIVALPSVAGATVYSGQATFTDLTTGNTLVVTGTPNPAPFTSSNLAIGQSYYDAGLMTINTSGNYATLFGATQTDSIALAFTFTAPSAATGAIGQAGTVSQTEFLLLPSLDYASLAFQNDNHVDLNGTYARQTVTFTDGAQIYLDVYDTGLNGSTTARAGQIDIRITNLKNPTPVPEPTSMALVAAGMIGVGAVRLRRRKSI